MSIRAHLRTHNSFLKVPWFASHSTLASTRPTAAGLQDVDDVEMFERRIHAMQTIGIKNEDLTEALLAPSKFARLPFAQKSENQ